MAILQDSIALVCFFSSKVLGVLRRYNHVLLHNIKDMQVSKTVMFFKCYKSHVHITQAGSSICCSDMLLRVLIKQESES